MVSLFNVLIAPLTLEARNKLIYVSDLWEDTSKIAAVAVPGWMALNPQTLFSLHDVT